jgi:hypothetical protein
MGLPIRIHNEERPQVGYSQSLATILIDYIRSRPDFLFDDLAIFGTQLVVTIFILKPRVVPSMIHCHWPKVLIITLWLFNIAMEMAYL